LCPESRWAIGDLHDVPAPAPRWFCEVVDAAIIEAGDEGNLLV
jgi:hypothetical protein